MSETPFSDNPAYEAPETQDDINEAHMDNAKDSNDSSLANTGSDKDPKDDEAQEQTQTTSAATTTTKKTAAAPDKASGK